jgi:hypothetical protein
MWNCKNFPFFYKKKDLVGCKSVLWPDPGRLNLVLETHKAFPFHIISGIWSFNKIYRRKNKKCRPNMLLTLFFRRTWAAARRHMARSGRSGGRRAATVAAHGSCSSSIDLPPSLFYYLQDWSKAADWRWGTLWLWVLKQSEKQWCCYIQGSHIQSLAVQWQKQLCHAYGLSFESCCTMYSYASSLVTSM